jgi:TetR/AcrR family transcriptional regulator, tetracycline repressor protein
VKDTVPTARRAATRPRARKRVNPPKEVKLSKEVICCAALELIDRKGLEQFSLRDVARSLGVYPRAIYWYVAGRSELLSEVVGYALREVYPPAADGDWKEWLRKLFIQYREAVRLHPNIAPLIGASLLSASALVPESIERILAVLSEAGFPEQHLVDVYNVIIAAQVGFVTLEFAMVPDDDSPNWSAEQKKRIGTIDVLRYPLLGRYLPVFANKAFILRWDNGSRVPLDSSFSRFVEVIIAGLEQLLK